VQAAAACIKEEKRVAGQRRFLSGILLAAVLLRVSGSWLTCFRDHPIFRRALIVDTDTRPLKTPTQKLSNGAVLPDAAGDLVLEEPVAPASAVYVTLGAFCDKFFAKRKAVMRLSLNLFFNSFIRVAMEPLRDLRQLFVCKVWW
jgi:hypothetical protein